MFQYLHPAGSFSKASNDLIMYISLAILFATFFLLFLSFRKEKSKIASVILLGICSCEMFFESVLTSYLYRYLSAKDFSKYVLDSEKLIDKIKNADSSAYRISQTSTNGFDFNTQITANYNESFGFNYKSIAGYTSDPDETQRMILERLGYNKMGDNMCIVNTSIIPADSLLGVKYVLSLWKIPEFVKREDLGSADGKAVYENPFAFPFAFKYTRENSSFLWADNPFEYTNQLYKTLANQNESVFVPIDSELTKNEQREKIWKIKSEMHPAVYAKVDCGHIDNTFMDVNGRYCQRYCSWLSPETIFVPTDFKDATVRISAPKDFSVSQTLFYACDFNVLRKAAETIRKNSASEITVKNGFCKFSIDGNEGEYLFTSIPCSEGWKIKLNGEIIKAEKFADSFISIPLRTGQNEIVMIYSVPGFFKGTIVLVLSLVFIVFAVRRRRVKKCSD